MQTVFVHGLGQNSSSWDKAISFMTKQIDTESPQLSLLLNGNDVIYTNLYQAFTDYCRNISKPINLCGLSLGAILALNYAIDYPMSVGSLVLIAAQYKMPKGLLKFQNFLFQLMSEKSFERMGFCKKDIISLTNSMMDLDFTAKLKEVSCATLIICGDKDKANKQAAYSLKEGIPNSKIHFIENTNHEINVEAPDKLAAMLDVFW